MRPQWLSRYYDAASQDAVTPSIVFDGKNYAVVRLIKKRGKAPGGVAYVGILKTGRSHIDAHTPLHEGAASSIDMRRMQDWLNKTDG